MSDFNINITDKEIRELLKLQLMESKEENALTQNLINMEATIAFANEPIILPSLNKEQDLIKKLNTKSISKFGLKSWFLSGLLTILVVGSALIMNNKKNENVPKLNTTSVTISTQEKTNKAIETIDFIESKNNSPEVKKNEKIIAAIDSPKYSSDKKIEATEYSPAITANNETSVQKSNSHENKTTNTNTSGANLTNVDTLFIGVKRLEVNGLICDVNIKPGSNDKVSLKGDIKIETKGVIRGKYDYKINYEKKDTVLKVWVEDKGTKNIVIRGSFKMEAFLNFEVPSNIDVVINSNKGNISVDGLQGKICNLNSSYGNITANNISTNVLLKSSSGDVALTEITGNVQAESSYGNQHFTNITGNLKTTCASGNIKLSTLKGDGDIVSSYGDISVNDCKGIMKLKASSGKIIASGIVGKTCNIQSSYGDIIAENIQAEDVMMVSKSGDITLTNVVGSLSLESSYGNQMLTGINGNIRTSSGSGNIKLEKVTGDIDITTTSGDVRANYTKGNFSAHVKSGSITGKQIELKDNLNLSASYGDIRMQIMNDVNDLSFDLQASYGSLKVDKNGKKFEGENGKLFLQQGKILVKGFSASGDQIYE